MRELFEFLKLLSEKLQLNPEQEVEFISEALATYLGQVLKLIEVSDDSQLAAAKRELAEMDRVEHIEDLITRLNQSLRIADWAKFRPELEKIYQELTSSLLEKFLEEGVLSADQLAELDAEFSEFLTRQLALTSLSDKASGEVAPDEAIKKLAGQS